jgi:hypothetical protein
MVVVPGIAAQDSLEMASIDDQEVVEAFGADGLHEPLGEGVGVWGPMRRLEDPGPNGTEGLVKAFDVLGVTISEEELCRDAGVV